MWDISIDVLERSQDENEGIQPFISLIEGGEEGEFWKEIEEYFHYAQIRRFLPLSNTNFAVKEKTVRRLITLEKQYL